MDNIFELPVTYKGEELLLPASLITYGYSYKIEIDIFGEPVYFEPDEEKNFRAVVQEGGPPIDKALLQLVAETLHELLG